MLSDLKGIGFVLGAFAILMGGLFLLRQRYSLPAESVRKLVHGGMGLAVLSLPWLFSSAWPVMLLTGSFVAIFLGLRVSRRLRQSVGSVLYAVDRDSWGEVYFALGVGALFLLTRNEPFLFCVPVLILAFGDSAASLAGERFGRWRFKAWGGNKSVEGSLSFLAVALVIANFALRVLTPLADIETLLVALTLALLVTLVEGIAGKGSDNLFVPLGAFVLLKSLLALDGFEIVVTSAIALAGVPAAFASLLWRADQDRAGKSSISRASASCRVPRPWSPFQADPRAVTVALHSLKGSLLLGAGRRAYERQGLRKHPW
jgi:phytol kinase